ncbi:hypothetical protein ACB092_01G103400 [Castanea dentata]
MGKKGKSLKNKPWNRETKLTVAPACLPTPAMNLVTCLAACVSVWWCGGSGKRKQSYKGDFSIWSDTLIFQFGLISVCDLGFKSDVIVCGRVFLAFIEILTWRGLIGGCFTPAPDPIYSLCLNISIF